MLSELQEWLQPQKKNGQCTRMEMMMIMSVRVKIITRGNTGQQYLPSNNKCMESRGYNTLGVARLQFEEHKDEKIYQKKIRHDTHHTPYNDKGVYEEHPEELGEARGVCSVKGTEAVPCVKGIFTS